MKLFISIWTAFLATLNGQQALAAEAGSFTQPAHKIYQQALELSQKDNVVFAQPKETLPADQLHFVVEIPAGSPNKYEMRTATGQVILDRVLCPRPVLGAKRTVHRYPAHYGFAINRFSSDGDPLDLVVLGSDREFRLAVESNQVVPTPVRVVGIMKMEECDDVPCRQDSEWSNDWKVLAVTLNDHRYGGAKILKSISQETLATLTEFFGNYKGPKNGHAQTRVNGYLNKQQSLEYLKQFQPVDLAKRKAEVTSCLTANKQLRAKWGAWQPKSAPPTDQNFLECMHRVFDPEFFANEQTLRRYINYGAYQLMRKKNPSDEALTLANSVEAMQKLKDKRKKHYRFVGIDRPRNNGPWASQGSGQLVLEWVKTKNRNKGCPDSFGPQHYSQNPLVDL